MELSNPIYTALIRKPEPVQEDSNGKQTTEVESNNVKGMTSSSLSRHQGPNANFVVYEKSGEALNHSYEQPNHPTSNNLGANNSSVTIYGCQTQDMTSTKTKNVRSQQFS